MGMIPILLVDDSEEDIELTRVALEKARLQGKMRIARSGEEAIQLLLSNGEVRLVLLDLHLPKASGLDVLRRIRINPATRDLPVVVLTGSKEEPVLLQSFTMGVSDYVIKPLEPERVTRLYRLYIQESQA